MTLKIWSVAVSSLRKLCLPITTDFTATPYHHNVLNFSNVIYVSDTAMYSNMSQFYPCDAVLSRKVLAKGLLKSLYRDGTLEIETVRVLRNNQNCFSQSATEQIGLLQSGWLSFYTYIEVVLSVPKQSQVFHPYVNVEMWCFYFVLHWNYSGGIWDNLYYSSTLYQSLFSLDKSTLN